MLLLWWALHPTPKRRNRTYITKRIWEAMAQGQKVTLEEAIAILRSNW